VSIETVEVKLQASLTSEAERGRQIHAPAASLAVSEHSISWTGDWVSLKAGMIEQQRRVSVTGIETKLSCRQLSTLLLLLYWGQINPQPYNLFFLARFVFVITSIHLNAIRATVLRP
jgi:hypothetical protein